jgi:hypothetical protein
MDNVELLCAEARRKLDGQTEDVRSVRSRAAGLLTAGGIISGLFGLQVTATPRPGSLHTGLVITALIAFTLLVVAAVIIEWPRTFHGDESLEPWIHEIQTGTAGDPHELPFHLATAYDTYRQKNAKIYTGLVRLFTAMCVLLGVEVVAWAAAVLA